MGRDVDVTAEELGPAAPEGSDRGDEAQVGGDETGYAGGEETGYAGGEETEYAGGDESEYAGGDETGYAGGDESEYPGGDESEYPGGDESEYPGGDESGYAGGYESEYPGGDEADEDELTVESLAGEALDELDLYGAAKPLSFVDVVLALPSTNPVVILREVDEPFRELHIPVGLAEGQAISYAARGIPTPKPLTHELFVDALSAFGLAVEVVRITNVAGRAFYADLVLSGNGMTKVIACRPSDGICLALRSILPVPITAAVHVLEEAGLPTEETD